MGFANEGLLGGVREWSVSKEAVASVQCLMRTAGTNRVIILQAERREAGKANDQASAGNQEEHRNADQ